MCGCFKYISSYFEMSVLTVCFKYLFIQKENIEYLIHEFMQKQAKRSILKS